MALDFSGSTAARVDHGSGAATNLSTGTICLWFYLPSFSERIPFKRGVGSTRWGAELKSFAGGSDGMEHVRSRATSNCRSQAEFIEFAAYGTGKWLFWAATFDVNGTDSDQKQFLGDATTPAAEPATYRVQLAGSGAAADISTASLIIGNSENFNLAFPGSIAFVGIWNRLLSRQEIINQQFRPLPTAGCVLFSFYDRTGTVPDLVGSSNGTTSSVVLAATEAPFRRFHKRYTSTASVASSGTVQSATLSDAFSPSDALDTTITAEQEISEGQGSFDDVILSVVIEGSVATDYLQVEPFTFEEELVTDISCSRTLSG